LRYLPKNLKDKSRQICFCSNRWISSSACIWHPRRKSIKETSMWSILPDGINSW